MWAWNVRWVRTHPLGAAAFIIDSVTVASVSSPGAIVAQQVLRHKSSKASFRFAFWGSVAVNVVAFVVMNSPLIAPHFRV